MCNKCYRITTCLAHGWRSVLNLEQQGHDLPLLLLLRRQSFLVDINEQFIKVLHVIRFHRRQVALWLQVHDLGLAVRRLHAEADRRPSQRRGRRRQLASWRPDWNVPSRRLQYL